jgi:hypothetical protein
MTTSEFQSLPPMLVPKGTPGIYIRLLRTGEVKIGSTQDIVDRPSGDEDLEGSIVLAILPGWRGVEADLHAKFRAFRSRDDRREFYLPVEPIYAFVLEIRDRGFTANDLRSGLWKGATHIIAFDDGQRLKLEVTYLLLIEEGQFTPRYIMERTCASCGSSRNSLEFLNKHSVRLLGRRAKREYLVLESSGVCAHCEPTTFPSNVAFQDGQTSIRIGRLVARSGELIQGYDRDWKEWVPLVDFGIRRMAKQARFGHKNDLSTLRLQPSIGRDGRAQGTL